MSPENTDPIPPESNPGAGVDARGNPVVDPTRNVLQLVTAAIQRQDDLRASEKEHVREVLALRSELSEQEQRCSKETAGLRAEYTNLFREMDASHNQQLREAEAARINAIRSVDVEAVQRAAEVQATQANTLATQVATSAETLRTQVAAAAQAASIALAAALEPVQKDISELRRAQYEGVGQKTQVAETQARGGSVGMWVGIAAMGVFSTFTLVAAVVALLVR